MSTKCSHRGEVENTAILRIESKVANIVIYDRSKWYCCKSWCWVAMTRYRDLHRVRFHKCERDNRGLSKLRESLIISNYKEQDDKAGRDIGGDYVEGGCLINMTNTHCQKCNELLTVDLEDGRVASNASCQKINDDVSHFKDNFVGLCVQCNCAFSIKISS